MQHKIDAKYKQCLKNLSRNARRLRHNKNLTQLELSMILGIGHRVYQQIESASPQDMKLSTMFKIIDYHGITFEELIAKD